jgi:hypothetical protein
VALARCHNVIPPLWERVGKVCLTFLPNSITYSMCKVVAYVGSLPFIPILGRFGLNFCVLLYV